MTRTYWRHPESDSYWASNEANPVDIDELCVDLDREEYHEHLIARFKALGGPYRVVVFGGRDFNDQPMLDSALDDFHRDCGIAVLIEGEARGADLRAKAWAKKRGVRVEEYPAPWDDIEHPDARVMTRRDGKKYDANAGPRRNQQMIDEGRPDCGIAFPGGSGTANMAEKCELAGVPVFHIAS
jgi:hypothetical protein